MSKVFVNIKTVLQDYCTQCLYWLNFFFWVYNLLVNLRKLILKWGVFIKLPNLKFHQWNLNRKINVLLHRALLTFVIRNNVLIGLVDFAKERYRKSWQSKNTKHLVLAACVFCQREKIYKTDKLDSDFRACFKWWVSFCVCFNATKDYEWPFLINRLYLTVKLD